MKLPIILTLILIFSFSVFAQQIRSKTIAENFTAVDMNGKTVELQALKGKIVVLTFWSTKCAICHAVIPELNTLVKNNAGKDVVFLALTMNSEATVSAYTRKNPFNYQIVPNAFDLVLKYADKDDKGNITMGFPAHFLVNKKGEIELKASGFSKTELLSSEIDRLLSTKKADDE